MSRLKSTGFTGACAGGAEEVLTVLKNPTEAKIPRVRSSRVLKLNSPNPEWNEHPVLYKLYSKGLGKSTTTLPVTDETRCKRPSGLSLLRNRRRRKIPHRHEKVLGAILRRAVFPFIPISLGLSDLHTPHASVTRLGIGYHLTDYIQLCIVNFAIEIGHRTSIWMIKLSTRG